MTDAIRFFAGTGLACAGIWLLLAAHRLYVDDRDAKDWEGHDGQGD